MGGAVSWDDVRDVELSVPEAAEVISSLMYPTSAYMLRGLIRRGIVRASTTGGNRYSMSASDVQRYMHEFTAWM